MKLRLPSWAVLLLICVAVGGALGLVNSLTEGPIAQQAVEAANAARRDSFADADSFEQVELAGDSGVDTCYMAMKDGQLAGYVAQVTVTGFGGPIEIHVGMDMEQTITGIKVGGSDFSETPGLGAVAAADSAKGEAFRNQFLGLVNGIVVDGEENSIDSMSGATITSKAVVSGVNAALDFVANLG